MNPTIPYLLTGLGGAAVSSIAVPVLHSNLSETKAKLEGELKEAKKKIDNPTQDDIKDALNNSLTKDSSSWKGSSDLSTSGITLGSDVNNVKCRHFVCNPSDGTGQYTYYLCRKENSDS